MSPTEVCEAVEKKYGIKISRHTLLRYQKAGLVSEPERGGFGMGKGRWTDYPPEAVEMAAIAFNLVHRVLAQRMNITQLNTGGTDVTKDILQPGTVVDITDAPEVVQSIAHLVDTGAVEELFFVVRLASGNYVVRWCGDILELLPRERKARGC